MASTSAEAQVGDGMVYKSEDMPVKIGKSKNWLDGHVVLRSNGVVVRLAGEVDKASELLASLPEAVRTPDGYIRIPLDTITRVTKTRRKTHVSVVRIESSLGLRIQGEPKESSPSEWLDAITLVLNEHTRVLTLEAALEAAGGLGDGVEPGVDDHRGDLDLTAVDESSTVVFGKHLHQLLWRDNVPSIAVHPHLRKMVAFVEAHGLETEGLYRVPGSQKSIFELRDAIDAGADLVLDDQLDPNVVGGLLKLYLRELSEPLIPFELYEAFIGVGAHYGDVDETTRTLYMKLLVDHLPKRNRVHLDFIVAHLVNVAKHSDVNLMALHNVALLFGALLLRPPNATALDMMQTTSVSSATAKLLIGHYDRIFSSRGSRFQLLACVRAAFTFEAQLDNELELAEGDIVFVAHEENDEWFFGYKNDVSGIFPKNFVSTIIDFVPYAGDAAGGDDSTSTPASASTPRRTSVAVEPETPQPDATPRADSIEQGDEGYHDASPDDASAASADSADSSDSSLSSRRSRLASPPPAAAPMSVPAVVADVSSPSASLSDADADADAAPALSSIPAAASAAASAVVPAPAPASAPTPASVPATTTDDGPLLARIESLQSDLATERAARLAAEARLSELESLLAALTSRVTDVEMASVAALTGVE